MRISCAAIVLICLITDLVDAGQIQFVVAELPGGRVHNDSYIISIESDDVARLNHARNLVDWVASGANPEESPGGTIVVANIVAGEDGINRDFLANQMPLWSWHTTQPVDFADFTIEILDGWPTFVEQDVDAWIANTNGAIGFWGYTVVQELKPVPEPKLSTLLIGLCPLVLRLRCRASLRRYCTRNVPETVWSAP